MNVESAMSPKYEECGGVPSKATDRQFPIHWTQPQTTRDLSRPSLNRSVRGNLSDTRPRCFVDTYYLTDWRGDTLLRELTILVELPAPLSSARRVRPCDHGKISGDPQGGALPPSHVSDMDS